MRTERRIVVITGASSGIGLGLLNHFEKAGDVVLDISLDGKDYQCDISDQKALKKVVDDIYKTYGNIDILISCAGYGLSGAVELIDESAAKKEFEVNFFGTANLCKYAIPRMNQNGKIILLSSAAALFPVPFKAYYCASKSAVDSFARCLKMELAKTNIQVTSICPGDIRTNFSANRVKDYQTNERYGDSIKFVTEPTAKTEAKRMSPEKAIAKIYNICEKEKLKPRYIIGFKYKCLNFCRKILPNSWFEKMIKNKFIKK